MFSASFSISLCNFSKLSMKILVKKKEKWRLGYIARRGVKLACGKVYGKRESNDRVGYAIHG